MLFNSALYIFLFLPVVVLVYFGLNRHRLVLPAKAWLVLASLFFYGYWNAKYVLLILCSMLVNYALGTALNRTKQLARDHHQRPRRKSILVLGIVFNLGLLGWFKYADFLLGNLNWVLDSTLPMLHLALPLAISFFTFQQIAYLVDCYQEDTQEYDFLNYALFVTFFPQLIAGPIVHHREMMPQFARVRNYLLRWRNVVLGLFIFAVGLFKKVVVADAFAVWADAGFGGEAPLRLLEAWGASLSYTVQLYYDFSGYSDMAIGAALLFNIRLPINFNSPYKATDIQDFWRRWHITLSRWLRDYLYIPLGGNRRGLPRTYANLFVTFLLGGLWHGAAWTFVVWGAMHGCALMLHRFWHQLGLRMPAFFGWLLTFFFVNTSWVLFRAESFAGAERVLRGMVNFRDPAISQDVVDQIAALLDTPLTGGWFPTTAQYTVSDWALLWALPVLIFSFLARNSLQISGYSEAAARIGFAKINLALLLFVVACYKMLSSSSQVFLYFNF